MSGEFAQEVLSRHDQPTHLIKRAGYLLAAGVLPRGSWMFAQPVSAVMNTLSGTWLVPATGLCPGSH